MSAAPRSAPGQSDDPASERDSVMVRAGVLADRDSLEIRIGGSGGQGVVLMGIILATAANHDRRCVVQTESYGPEARGGYSRSDVIIANDPIDYPKLVQADLLVALSQEAANAYVEGLSKDGVFIYDSDNVTTPPHFKGTTIGIPFTRLAKEETGRVQTTNVLALGAVVGITGIVTLESIHQAVLEEVPKGTQELNSRALARGLAVDQSEWDSSHN
jgi:2-oxoglutarate ferredoxin oxidoreductase subunit gamma